MLNLTSTETIRSGKMGYLIQSESEKRLAAVRKILEEKNLDLALIYYDECNIGNGWYLTGWCPQFESGAVLVPRKGTPLLLGGPESEPFAKQDSAVKETRNFPVFMVPDEEYPAATIIDFPQLFAELNANLGAVKRIGIVGILYLLLRGIFHRIRHTGIQRHRFLSQTSRMDEAS